jgi:hypothetical protein
MASSGKASNQRVVSPSWRQPGRTITGPDQAEFFSALPPAEPSNRVTSVTPSTQCVRRAVATAPRLLLTTSASPDGERAVHHAAAHRARR